MMEKDKTALEAMPHICDRVCAMWGSLEFDVYVNSLVMDSRGGARKGLPMAVGEDLLWLQGVNKLHRALGIQERLKISLRDANAKVQMEDDASRGHDVWAVSGAGAGLERRHTNAANSNRGIRPSQENTLLWGIYDAVTGKYSISLIVAVLTLKFVWPSIKAIF